jgi:hypothetical protein
VDTVIDASCVNREDNEMECVCVTDHVAVALPQAVPEGPDGVWESLRTTAVAVRFGFSVMDIVAENE